MFLFILNPTAGKGRSVQSFETVKAIFDQKEISYEVWETQFAGGATELAKKAVEQGYRNIIAVGGDGTVLEVATGLMGADCTMGVIPAGTGNDFVRSLGMTADVEQAAEVILKGNKKRVDVGKTLDNKYFINVAGCGFDTEVLCNMDRFKKYFKGQIPYILGVLKALLGYSYVTAKIELDDRVIEQDIYLMAVANGKAYGGGMKVAPDADITDGLFDITIVDRVSKLTVLSILPKFIKGKHDSVKQIKRYRSAKVTVSCTKNVPLNMDGEVIGTTPMTFEIIPEALEMFASEQ